MMVMIVVDIVVAIDICVVDNAHDIVVYNDDEHSMLYINIQDMEL